MTQISTDVPVKTPAESDPERVKLLLVDDDPDNLLALEAILDPLHQQLMLAPSGNDALRLCLDNDFAAILLDVRMPGMDGFETAEMIRARRRSSHTPILFLTAYRSDEQLFRGYDMGAVDFLFKPIVPEVLQSKVSVFVELTRNSQLLRRKSEELARAEQTFRSVLEAAPDAMLITDRDGTIVLANSRSDSLFGYSRESLVDRNIRTLVCDWNCPEPATLADPVPPPRQRFTALRRDGSVFPADITRSPFSTNGRLLVTTAVRDATDQVDAEERIRRVNLELERRVQERTAELTRSNDALRQFAWAASHDLQEPARTALSYAQWLKEAASGKLDDEQREMLRVIEASTGNMHHLLGALKQYIFVSESALKLASVDCNVVVRGVLDSMQAIVNETGAKIVCGSLPVMPCTEGLLTQVLQNLIGNALKYRSDRSPVVVVESVREGDGWVFSVSDNGIGIEPRYFDYIFGVFKRLHRAEISGTGIGLSICRSAVERMGGRIWLESVPGEGSTFRFFLPEVSNEL